MKTENNQFNIRGPFSLTRAKSEDLRIQFYEVTHGGTSLANSDGLVFASLAQFDISFRRLPEVDSSSDTVAELK